MNLFEIKIGEIVSISHLQKSSVEDKDFESVSYTASLYRVQCWGSYLFEESNEADNEINLILEKVNKTQEVGIYKTKKSPLFLFVPKTNGKEDVFLLIDDLFRAAKQLEIKVLLLTHWDIIRSRFPKVELQSIFNYIFQNKDIINIEKLYFDIDERFQDQFTGTFNNVFSTNISRQHYFREETFDDDFYQYLAEISIDNICDCCSPGKTVDFYSLEHNKNNTKLYFQNIFLQGIYEYKRVKYEAALGLFRDYAILAWHSVSGPKCSGVLRPNMLKEKGVPDFPLNELRQFVRDGLRLIGEETNITLLNQIVSDSGV